MFSPSHDHAHEAETVARHSLAPAQVATAASLEEIPIALEPHETALVDTILALRQPQKTDLSRADSPKGFFLAGQREGTLTRTVHMEAFRQVFKALRAQSGDGLWSPDNSPEFLPILKGVIQDESLPINLRETAISVVDSWFYRGEPLHTGQLLPYTESMSDLFNNVQQWGHSRESISYPAGGLTLSDYMMVRGGDSWPKDQPLPTALRVSPSDLVRRACSTNMISIQGDRLHFEAIPFDNQCRIYVKYGQIIGSRLLSVLPVEDFKACLARIS